MSQAIFFFLFLTFFVTLCINRRKMIRVEGITKRFGDLEVLRGIDLEIHDGLITSVVGPSGAGKTTFLQILGTLARPDSGRVFYGDTDVFSLKDKALSAFRNSNIGFVFQLHRLLPEFTILENVAMPAFIAGRPRREAFAEARRLLENLGLSHRLNHRPTELSGGECQRGAVARALINNPGVILADEPSGSLDSTNRRELHKLFFDLRDSLGATFVIVTHDENLAADSDVVVNMSDGLINEVTKSI